MAKIFDFLKKNGFICSQNVCLKKFLSSASNWQRDDKQSNHWCKMTEYLWTKILKRLSENDLNPECRWTKKIHLNDLPFEWTMNLRKVLRTFLGAETFENIFSLRISLSRKIPTKKQCLWIKFKETLNLRSSFVGRQKWDKIIQLTDCAKWPEDCVIFYCWAVPSTVLELVLTFLQLKKGSETIN